MAVFTRLLTGVQAHWLGCTPAPVQRIYFANHSSNLDAPVIWASLPDALRARTRPVAARDYWEATWLRRYMAERVYRVVMVDRNHTSQHPTLPMEQAIEAGESLIIFPEGRRGFDEDAGMSAFRPGLYHLAQQYPHVELVPVFLANLNRILPRGEVILIPLIAIVKFGAPLQSIAGESKEDFLGRARDAVAALEHASG